MPQDDRLGGEFLQCSFAIASTFVNSPSNPSGVVLPRIEDHGLGDFVDEVVADVC